MQVIVVGLGVQGKKRTFVAGEDLVSTVDPIDETADYKSVFDVPLDLYDSAILCVPDDPKLELIDYLISQNKSVMVEKPLLGCPTERLVEIEQKAKQKSVKIYCAYNHRFEPHFCEMKEIISNETLGQIYTCRLFYGNGTAVLVRESEWRDQGDGVLADLGSHMLDLLDFWFNEKPGDVKLVFAKQHENKAPDHVVFTCEFGRKIIEVELSLLSWRNTFRCDLIGAKGSAHIDGLCKWGPSTLSKRTRVFPSGIPDEQSTTFVQADPTWQQEYLFFKEMISSDEDWSLRKDVWIEKTLAQLSNQINRCQV